LPKAGEALPNRDFYYSVTFEAIAYASKMWKSRRVGTSHLSAAQNFHKDIATSQAEALAHFCNHAAVPAIRAGDRNFHIRGLLH
jgi:hypothetical protein